MRFAVYVALLMLGGCARQPSYTSLCDIQGQYRGAIGSEVTFPAMLIAGGIEHPPLVVDGRCWFGISADLRNAPINLQRAFDTPGRFNKFAVVSGRIRLFNGKPQLQVTTARQVRVDRPMSEIEEQAFFDRMVRERNAFVAAHR
jgi:hypothetical protein